MADLRTIGILRTPLRQPSGHVNQQGMSELGALKDWSLKWVGCQPSRYVLCEGSLAIAEWIAVPGRFTVPPAGFNWEKDLDEANIMAFSLDQLFPSMVEAKKGLRILAWGGSKLGLIDDHLPATNAGAFHSAISAMQSFRAKVLAERSRRAAETGKKTGRRAGSPRWGCDRDGNPLDEKHAAALAFIQTARRSQDGIRQKVMEDFGLNVSRKAIDKIRSGYDGPVKEPEAAPAEAAVKRKSKARPAKQPAPAAKAPAPVEGYMSPAERRSMVNEGIRKNLAMGQRAREAATAKRTQDTPPAE